MKEKMGLSVTDKFFAIWGFGDIPLGKKLWWSMVLWLLLLINFYAAGAFLLFLVALYKKRGGDELKIFMEIQGGFAMMLSLFILMAVFMVIF